MAVKNDWSCFKGSKFEATGTQQPIPTDISGWTITFTLRKDATDVVILTQSCTLVTPGGGIYKLTLTHAQTLIAAGVYEYDIWRTDVGNETPLSYGSFTVVQGILYP